MQRDVKVGIAIGVLLIALIAIFWWTKQSNRPPTPPEPRDFNEPVLPPAVEPALPPSPVGAGTTTPGGAGATTPPAPTGTTPMGPGTATTTEAPVPPPPPAAKKTYKTQQGDSLATIAAKFYNDQNKWQPIYEANKATVGPDPNRLKVGLDLVIPDLPAAGPAMPPKRGAPTPPAAGQQKHVVATGETLSSIAKKYYNSDSKANIDRIYQANKAQIGTDPDNIQVGMELVIPPAR